MRFTSSMLSVYLKDILILILGNTLEISGCNLTWFEHPSNNEWGGICIYYKNFLALRILNVQYLQECINFSTKIGDIICIFKSLYRSPSQTLDDFKTFSNNFELNLENLVQRNTFLVLTIKDFNAKSSKWQCQINQLLKEMQFITNVTIWIRQND